MHSNQNGSFREAHWRSMCVCVQTNTSAGLQRSLVTHLKAMRTPFMFPNTISKFGATKLNQVKTRLWRHQVLQFLMEGCGRHSLYASSMKVSISPRNPGVAQHRQCVQHQQRSFKSFSDTRNNEKQWKLWLWALWAMNKTRESTCMKVESIEKC